MSTTDVMKNASVITTCSKENSIPIYP